MPKLVYVYGDDNKMLDTLVTSLRSNGYSIEYTNLTDEVSTGNITADIALICKPVSPTTKFSMGGLTIDLDNMAAYDSQNNPHPFHSHRVRHAHLPDEELLPGGSPQRIAARRVGLRQRFRHPRGGRHR